MIPVQERNSLLMLQTAYFIVSLIAAYIMEVSRNRETFFWENLEHFRRSSMKQGNLKCGEKTGLEITVGCNIP